MAGYGRCAALLVAAMLLTPPLRAQSLPEALAGMQSADYAERRAAFYALVDLAVKPDTTTAYKKRVAHVRDYARQHPEVGHGLISLLSRENAESAPKPAEDPYTGDLIAVVAGLQDPAALRPLMGVINTGDLAMQGLAALGDAAAPDVITAAEGLSYPTRVSALHVLARMATGGRSREMKPDRRADIRRVLLHSLQDTNRFARQAALDGLVAFNDAEIRGAIARVVAGDPYVQHDNGRDRYPVRELAAATLKKMGTTPDSRP